MASALCQNNSIRAFAGLVTTLVDEIKDRYGQRVLKWYINGVQNKPEQIKESGEQNNNFLLLSQKITTEAMV